MFKIALLLLLVTLSGCSTLQKGVCFKSIDELIESHQYQQAIDQAKQQNPEDAALIKNIERQANIYRRQQLRHVNLLLEQKQWAKANAHLFVLTSTLPDHRQFQRTQNKLNQLRKHERLTLACQEALAKANYLHSQTQSRLFEYRDKQTDLFWWQSSSPLKYKKHLLAEKLITYAQQAILQNDLLLAKKAYKEAINLNEMAKSETINRSIKQGLAKKNAANIQQQQAKLVRQLNEAMIEENFDQIISLVNRLSKPSFKGNDVKEAIESAQSLLVFNAKELDLLGDSVYRQGDIERAMALWQQAQTLNASMTELKDKINRAKKIQNKLNSLRESQNQ
ncbi:MAG: hypothetical protein JXR16_01060 [Bermanella sp.]